MRRFSLLLLPVLLSVTACQSVMPGGGGAAAGRDAELARLEDKVRELERQSRMNEVEVARLKRQMAAMADRLEDAAVAPAASSRSTSPRPTAPPPAMMPAPAETPAAAVPPLPPGAGRLEAEDLEMTPPASAPEPVAESPAEVVAEAPAPTPVTGDGQELYDRGYTLYHQGSYVDAESSFQTFLQLYGASDLADNAQFWIGEARLRRGDLNGALAAFRETVTRFPRGNKVPDAMFRGGDCLEKLGDLDGARDAWRQTIERFPNSAAAALSEERLAAVP